MLQPSSPLVQLSDDTLLNCMHCGLCLPHCPTYQLEPLERYSPRGRIQLARLVYEGALSEPENHADISESIESCLGCLACETACPAGVEYEKIFEAAKSELQQSAARPRTVTTLLLRLMMRHVFTRPRLFKLLSRLTAFLQSLPLEKFLPPRLRRLFALAPPFTPPFFDETFVEISTIDADKKERVLMLSGCVMNTAFADVHQATVFLLRQAEFQVKIPHTQVCCGALAAHNGFLEEARTLALKNISAFKGTEKIVVNSAGCGSMMKRYADLFPEGDASHEEAKRFSARVKDLSEALSGEDIQPVDGLKVTYQDACHLEHGQHIRQQPRALLKKKFGGIIELASPECCGSAGIYNLLQPDRAEALLQKKLDAIARTGADYVVTSNPGCLMWLQYGLAQSGSPTQAIHLATALSLTPHSTNTPPALAGDK